MTQHRLPCTFLVLVESKVDKIVQTQGGNPTQPDKVRAEQLNSSCFLHNSQTRHMGSHLANVLQTCS